MQKCSKGEIGTMTDKRVMSTEEMAKSVAAVIYHLLERKKSVVVGIDGRCGAGKTSFAKELQNIIDCNVIHTDDFFLRPEQRTKERLAKPGGNIDYERFRKEVILPLKEKSCFTYGIYDCHEGRITKTVAVEPKAVTIIEGAYSFHPQFSHIYDLKIFMDVEAQEQQRRIIERNGSEQLPLFTEKWIPLEEKYFDTFLIKEECDIVIQI